MPREGQLEYRIHVLAGVLLITVSHVEYLQLRLKNGKIPVLESRQTLPQQDITKPGREGAWTRMIDEINKVGLRVMKPVFSALLQASHGKDWEGILASVEAAAEEHRQSGGSNNEIHEAIIAN